MTSCLKQAVNIGKYKKWDEAKPVSTMIINTLSGSQLARVVTYVYILQKQLQTN